MRGRRFLLVLPFGVLLGILLSVTPAAAVSLPIEKGASFFESSCPGGDAGNTQPLACSITGGSYGNIHGNLGDPSTDTTDYYVFHWDQAGRIRAAYISGTYEFYIDVYQYVAGGVGAKIERDTTFGGPDDFLSKNSLPVGYYVVGISMDDLDPPYTLGLFNLDVDPLDNPFSAGPVTSTSAVPEPATLLLLGSGLAIATRRKKTA